MSDLLLDATLVQVDRSTEELLPNLVLLTDFLPKFRIGATVRLKSGSPMLTVTATHHAYAEVQWFEGTEAKQKIYPVAALQEARKRRKINV